MIGWMKLVIATATSTTPKSIAQDAARQPIDAMSAPAPEGVALGSGVGTWATGTTGGGGCETGADGGPGGGATLPLGTAESG